LYTCSCNAGYQSVSGDTTLVCVDINECLNTPCPTTQRCINSPGTYTCLQAVCLASPNICTDQNAQCISTNTVSGYTCACRAGYRATATATDSIFTCTNINECLNALICGQFQVCIDNQGSYTCQPEQCVTGRCSGNQICTNTNVAPGFTCACPANTVLAADGVNCVTPCVRNPCPSNAVCANSGTSRTCSCANGYTAVRSPIDDISDCRDVNECTELSPSGQALHTCISGQQCVNLIPGFRCDTITVVNNCGTAQNPTQQGFRFPHATSKTQFVECNGAGQEIIVNCPNSQIGIGLDANSNSITVSNGIWFSPVFLTCVNTTTNAAPGIVPKLANGNWDLKQACVDISDTTTNNGVIVATKLPLDVGVTTPCLQWLGCKNQKLEKEEETIPSSGDCSTSLQGYHRDERTCKESTQMSCPVRIN